MTENTAILPFSDSLSMIIKSIVIIAFVLIITSLGSALFHLVKHNSSEQSAKTAKALTFRITLSILLFIFLFVAFATGIFKPHGIGMQMHRPAVTEQP